MSAGFERLKELLTTAPVLTYPRFGPGEEFVLETDASLEGFEVVLSQRQEDGHVHPIVCAARSLLPHERNYAINELETLHGCSLGFQTFQGVPIGALLPCSDRSFHFYFLA